MKRPNSKKLTGKNLRKYPKLPKGKVRVMQISNATTIPFVPLSMSTSTTKTADTSELPDSASLRLTSASFASLVKEAKAYPEVRTEVVAAYQAQVASGHYPPKDVMSGLASLLSGQSAPSDDEA